jgi:hypothetical protein
MLTAALALATIVLLAAVVTLSALHITSPQAVAPASGSVGENPPVIGAGGEHYGDDWNNYGHDFDQPNPAQTGLGPGSPATYNATNGNDPIERHAEVVERLGEGRLR